jgi:hypothetical protein
MVLFDSVTSVFSRSLRSPCGSSFLIGFLHTEIAKITKTDQDWMTLFDSVTLCSFASFAISVWIGFSDRILHTEIAKIAKTDSDWMNLSIP